MEPASYGFVAGVPEPGLEGGNARTTRVCSKGERSLIGESGGRFLRVVLDLAPELPNGPCGETDANRNGLG
jgi:hypothetical protein